MIGRHCNGRHCETRHDPCGLLITMIRCATTFLITHKILDTACQLKQCEVMHELGHRTERYNSAAIHAAGNNEQLFGFVLLAL